MDQTYRARLIDGRDSAPLPLTATSDDAARRQALQFTSELLRDRALNGSLDQDLSLELTAPDGRIFYRITVSFSAADPAVEPSNRGGASNPRHSRRARNPNSSLRISS